MAPLFAHCNGSTESELWIGTVEKEKKNLAVCFNPFPKDVGEVQCSHPVRFDICPFQGAKEPCRCRFAFGDDLKP